MVEAVSAGEGAIGYADASQAGELGIAKIKVGNEYAEPTPEAAAKIARGVAGRQGTRAAASTCSPSNSTARPNRRGRYPIVLVSYLIACTNTTRPTKRRSSRRYLEYVDQPRRAGSWPPNNAGSAPLSAALTKKIDARRSKRSRARLSPRPVARTVDTTTNAGQLLAAASGGRRRRGDRSSPTPRSLAGVTILALLAGVAIFLVSEGCPASPPSASELPEGKSLVDYVAPLAFGTVLAAALAVAHRGPAGGRGGALHHPHRAAAARARRSATSSTCWRRSRASSTASGGSSSSARRRCR